MEPDMKRLVAASLALSSVAAHADTSTYVWLGKSQWTDAKLQAATQSTAVRPHQMQVGAQYPSQCRTQTQLRTGLSKPQPNGEI
jgi:hypothetical protein